MLSALRAFSQTWAAKILFGVLIVSFGAFGISNVITDLGTNTVARVGEQDITLRDYQRAYNTQLNQLAQQMGSMPTLDQATAMGIPGMVLGQLAADAAINQLASSMGIGVSDARLAKMLREDPSFAGGLGAFDRQNFLRVLQQNGYTEGDYFELQTRAARRQQLAAGLFADATVPQAAIELVNRYAGDTRTLKYVVLNAATLPDVTDPTEEELAAYLKEHQTEFRTKETRTADVLLLSPATLAANKTVSDADIQAEFERTKATLGKPEQRTVQQVVLPSPELKAAFEAGKAAGKTLAQLAQENNLQVTALGTMTKAQIIDATLANAAFGLSLGDFTIIPGVAGERAVGVSAIEPGGTPALEEVKEQIRQVLAEQQARNEINDILDQIEELRAAFKPLGEIAERFNLPVKEVKLTDDGAALEAVDHLEPTDRAKVTTAIFGAEQGKLAATVALASNRNLWFDLKSVEPARDQTLDEVRDVVHDEIMAQRTDAAAAAEAQKLVDQIKAGGSLDDIAAGMGLFPTTSPAISRSGDGTPVINPDVATAAFAGGPGLIGSAKNGDGEYVVFEVTEVTPPEASNAQVTGYVENGTRDGMFSDFVSGVRADYGVHENQAALSQLLSGNGQ